MYKCVPNSVVKISMMFAKDFEYYTIILRGAFFVDTQCSGAFKVWWIFNYCFARNLLLSLSMKEF